MSEKEGQELGKTLWKIADNLRGSMNADEFYAVHCFAFVLTLPRYAINTLA
jgi:type I restriction-modification system DNA methylase subunit